MIFLLSFLTFMVLGVAQHTLSQYIKPNIALTLFKFYRIYFI